MRKLLLLSCSALHGSGLLEYAQEYIIEFFKKNSVKRVLFIPYASPEAQEKYTARVRHEMQKWGKGYQVQGLNEVSNPIEAINNAQSIFIGGGNTFLLLKRLLDNELIEPIRKRVVEDGIPYLGSSAGTNVATCSICTTNDMPIVHVPSLEALGLVPFNINPHYFEPDPDSQHMGETRERRIQEYHMLGDKPPVLGLPEGTFLHVRGSRADLGGLSPAVLFVQGSAPKKLNVGTDLSFIFELCGEESEK